MDKSSRHDSRDTRWDLPAGKPNSPVRDRRRARLRAKRIEELGEELARTNCGFVTLKPSDELVSVLAREFTDEAAACEDDSEVELPRAIAKELYDCWRKSKDIGIIEADAEYARRLQADEELSGSFEGSISQATVNAKDESDERVAEDTLRLMFPDLEDESLRAVYVAHRADFDSTVAYIQEHFAMKPTMADVVKGRKTSTSQIRRETAAQQQQQQKESRAKRSSYRDADALLAKAREHREQALRERDLQRKYKAKSRQAYREKNPALGARYADMALAQGRKANDSHARAAELILEANGCRVNTRNTLDLHYLRVDEALVALDRFIRGQLDDMPSQAKRQVHVITGWGARAIGNCARIKPAVLRALDALNIRFHHENRGMLKLCLEKR